MSADEFRRAIERAVRFVDINQPWLPGVPVWGDHRANKEDRARFFIAHLSGGIEESDPALAAAILSVIRKS